jgi:signal peptide peptidase SppA
MAGSCGGQEQAETRRGARRLVLHEACPDGAILMLLFSRKPKVPVLRLTGTIGMVTPLRPGLSLATLSAAIDKAFAWSKVPAVALVINSPGGSAVQSHLIYRRIRQLAAEKEKKVYVFCEDVAASGGYFLALSGDEINADPSSIIGSIGVVSSGFGFDKAIAKLGIDRRVYTAGPSKAQLDPFLPEKPEDIERLRALQRDVHDAFIAVVKERRGQKLQAPDHELFSGAFWSGPRAVELGLIDGLTDVHTRMRELFGDNVRIQNVPVQPGGLLSRLRRVAAPYRLASREQAADALPMSLADDFLSAIETRALWSRFGL